MMENQVVVSTSFVEIPNTTSTTTNGGDFWETTELVVTSSRETIVNGTGFFIDEEAIPGLNDVETFFLSCIITIVPLFILVLTAFAIRLLWKRYKSGNEPASEDDDFLKEESSDSISRPLHTHLLNSDKDKCQDSHVVSIVTGDENIPEASNSTTNGSRQSFRNNHSNTNGSIITMTLKNNHLIVEKEERNDLEEDSRETIMKYSPDTRDGIFVVEVQQGVRRSPTSGEGKICVDSSEQTDPEGEDQCALVHSPPERCAPQDPTKELQADDHIVPTSPILAPSTPPSPMEFPPLTGLCQSDQSLTGHHQSYSYSNQQGYDHGGRGYPVYSGYVNEEAVAKIRGARDSRKPKITSAVYKNRKDTLDFDPMSDGPLLSDVMMKKEMSKERNGFSKVQEELEFIESSNMLKTGC